LLGALHILALLIALLHILALLIPPLLLLFLLPLLLPLLSPLLSPLVPAPLPSPASMIPRSLHLMGSLLQEILLRLIYQLFLLSNYMPYHQYLFHQSYTTTTFANYYPQLPYVHNSIAACILTMLLCIVHNNE
jgi:hypothetical protein